MIQLQQSRHLWSRLGLRKPHSLISSVASGVNTRTHALVGWPLEQRRYFPACHATYAARHTVFLCNNKAPWTSIRLQAQTEIMHLQASLDSSEAQNAAVRQERDALAAKLNQACIPSATTAT